MHQNLISHHTSRCHPIHHHLNDNWRWLSCKVVLCGILVNDMYQHYQPTNHSLFISCRYNWPKLSSFKNFKPQIFHALHLSIYLIHLFSGFVPSKKKPNSLVSVRQGNCKCSSSNPAIADCFCIIQGEFFFFFFDFSGIYIYILSILHISTT